MSVMFVTGGCGFIGSNFVRHMLATDRDVSIINFDCLTYAGNLENLADLKDHPRYSFVRGDITDKEAVSRHPEQRHRFHNQFRGRKSRRSEHSRRWTVRADQCVGYADLTRRRPRVLDARYVQVSTDEVYGSLGATGYFTESTPLAANSPYAASKAAADLLVRAYSHTFGLPALTTRCSNNYGPYQFPEKLIPLFISNLSRDLQVPVYGDGLQVRDWIHVRDHCEAIRLVWKSGQPGEVYNIGGNCEKTNLELTHTLLQLLGKPTSLIRYVQDRPGHDRRYAIDSSKIERELGWKPKIPFADGLRETVEWYKTNANWVEHVRSGEYLKYYERQYGMNHE